MQMRCDNVSRWLHVKHGSIPQDNNTLAKTEKGNFTMSALLMRRPSIKIHAEPLSELDGDIESESRLQRIGQSYRSSVVTTDRKFDKIG
jgi:hypothetical protein